MVNYGHEFKLLRELKGYSLTQVANEARLSKSTLSRFENGETQLALDKFIAALTAMGLSLSDFERGSVGEDTILLVDAKDEPATKEVEDPLKEGAEAIWQAFKATDPLALLSLHESLSDQTESERILKLLAKVCLSRLSLHLLLAEEDQEFLVAYFKTSGVESLIFSYFLEVVDEAIWEKLLSVLTTHHLPDSQVRALATHLTKRLEKALDDRDYEEARGLNGLLKQLLSAS